MIKKIISIIAICLSFIILSSCSSDKDTDRTINEPAASGGWTIMVWLDADNNLENDALEDFNEMEYGLYLASLTDPAVTNKIKIIVQVDRHPLYDNYSEYTGTNWSDTRRYIIRPDTAENMTWTSQRIDNELGEVNMGDAGSLKEFIEYCHEHFPADNYALILWNHGGGLMKKVAAADSRTYLSSTVSKSICNDDTDDDELFTGEITDVLTAEHSVGFMGFDACLMGMLEVAYEYRPGVTGKFSTDAICFSPAIEQSDGWDYVRILTRLKGTGTDAEGDTCYDAASLTPQVFAGICGKEYRDYCTAESLTTEAQTAVDNTKVADVKTAMDSMAAAITTAGVGVYKSIIEAIRGSGSSTVTMEYFSESGTSQWFLYPFFDLYDFALRMKNSGLSIAGFSDDSTGPPALLMSAINNFIIYSYAGSSFNQGYSSDADAEGTTSFIQGSNGLSFFLPEGDGTYTVNTVEFSRMHGYTSLNVESSGLYYGMLDFCEPGNTADTVETWYELMMEMYWTTGMEESGCWPDPPY